MLQDRLIEGFRMNKIKSCFKRIFLKRVKPILNKLGWLLSPTRKLIDCWKNKAKTKKQKGNRLRCWNTGLFIFELFLVIVYLVIPKYLSYLHLPVWVCLIVKLPLIIYAFSRCNEIAFAFYNDVFRSLKQEEATSNLTSVNRIAMAMRSYVGLIVNFAFLYYLIPSVNLIKCFDFFKMEESCGDFFKFIYFSGVTLTTLGYGDITPKHWLSQLLALYEVLVGILFVVVVIATYISSIQVKIPEVKITSLNRGDEVPYDKSTTVIGTLEKSLPHGYQLFVLQCHDGKNYFPQGKVVLSHISNGKISWKSENFFKHSTTITVVAAHERDGGIFKYYQKLCREQFAELQHLTPISNEFVPKDVVTCCEVFVNCYCPITEGR